MAKTVTTIPATISKFTAAPIDSKVKRKVAGYARVSTDHEDQVSSYTAQVDYYTKYIKEREDWEFAGMYTDEGVTGTSTKKREGFTRMIKDALDGKIQLIITKSVSRFARNTVDCLTTIRKLKASGVTVFPTVSSAESAVTGMVPRSGTAQTSTGGWSINATTSSGERRNAIRPIWWKKKSSQPSSRQ